MMFTLKAFEFLGFIFCIEIGLKKYNQPKNEIQNID